MATIAHTFECLFITKRHYLRGIRRCALVGVDVSLLEEVSDCDFKKLKPDSLSLSSYCLKIHRYNSQLLLQYHVYLHATMLPTMMTMN